MSSNLQKHTLTTAEHNLTELHPHEAARQTQERASYLEAIFEAMVDGVYVYDRHGRIVSMNSAARMQQARIAPLDMATLPANERLTNMVITNAEGQRLTPEQWPITRLLQGEQFTPKQTVELQTQTHDGSFLYTSVTGGPIRNADGQIIGAVAISRDVTEQKHREREHEQQAQQLRVQASLIERAHDAIVVRDPLSHIISWNQGAKNLYGWTDQEVHGQIIHTLLQTRFPVSQEDVQHHLERDGQWEGELVHTCRDGRLVIVESRQILVRDSAGRPNAILEINRDITERHRIQQIEREAKVQMEARLTLLQLILDEVPSCIYLVRGSDARLVLANRAATEVFGATWAPNQPLLTFLSQHHIRIFGKNGCPLEPEQLLAFRALKHGKAIRHYQQVIRHHDETALPVLADAVPLDATQLSVEVRQIISSSDEPEPAALVVYQDVTALKEAEALKDEFVSIATHELRSPMTVLKGYADMLTRQSSRGKGMPLTEWQQKSLQGITQAITRLANLTEDLLDVTRLQAEKFNLSSEPTDFVSITTEVVRQQRVTTQLHQITLHTNQAHLTVNIDPKRLEQIITNLLTNAIKYSPQGGSIEVTLSMENASRQAVLTIRDHGMGIPAQQQSRIFGRFMRADNARSSNITGTGLGLYLCRELLERYGGRICFESTEGIGSTFFVALPTIVEEQTNDSETVPLVLNRQERSQTSHDGSIIA